MLVDAPTRQRLLRLLPADRWQLPEHRAAVGALEELERRKIQYDVAAVRRLFPEVPIPYLEELVQERPEVPVDLQQYVDLVRWDAVRADVVRGPLDEFTTAILDPRAEPAKVKSLARGIGDAFGAWRDDSRLLAVDVVVGAMEKNLRARLKGHAIFPFGIPAIDVHQDQDDKPRLIPGCRPGKITIVTGCPGSGKSTLACRIALGQARQRRKVLYGAWEMTGDESLELLAVMSLAEEGVHVSRTALQTGKGAHVDEMVERVIDRGRQIAPFVRFFSNPFDHRETSERDAKRANRQNLDIIEHLIRDTGADVFIADLWERCLADAERNTDVMKALQRQQSMCEETRCHGILLHQQRKGSGGENLAPRPTAQALRGTGAWWDIADTILGVFRPGQWKAVPDDVIVIDVLKQRWGPWPLSVEVEWDVVRAHFGAGTSVEYDQPGTTKESELDAWTGPEKKPKGRGR
jgi:archaellum biogenesis ATPase FlaH